MTAPFENTLEHRLDALEATQSGATVPYGHMRDYSAWGVSIPDNGGTRALALADYDPSQTQITPAEGCVVPAMEEDGTFVVGPGLWMAYGYVSVAFDSPPPTDTQVIDLQLSLGSMPDDPPVQTLWISWETDNKGIANGSIASIDVVRLTSVPGSARVSFLQVNRIGDLGAFHLTGFEVTLSRMG